MLKNLVAVVTGGASGLGKATVERFIEKGVKVVFCDINKTRGDEVVKQFGEDNCSFVHADVASEKDVKTLIDHTKKKFNQINVVVNCAGVSFRTTENNSLAEFKRIVTTNLTGTYNVCRLAASTLHESNVNETSPYSVIINTAGLDCDTKTPYQLAYASANAGIQGMTKALAADLSPSGIRVVTIASHIFRSPLKYLSPDEAKSLKTANNYAQLVQNIVLNNYLNGITIRLETGMKV